MDKFLVWIESLIQKIPKSAPGAAMRYIVWYALFLIVCCVLDVSMILADWYVTGRPNLSEMRQLLSILLSGATVAAIGFICRWLVDNDGNGVPDEAENPNRTYPPYPNTGKGNSK